MQAHKMRVVIPENHQLELHLPSDFPVGQADVIVITDSTPSPQAVRSGQEAAREFGEWLKALHQRLPPAPILPPEAFDRESIYRE